MARVYTKEELTACGTANCGCVNYAEQGIPCIHDLALLYGTSAEEQETKLDIDLPFDDRLPDPDLEAIDARLEELSK